MLPPVPAARDKAMQGSVPHEPAVTPIAAIPPVAVAPPVAVVPPPPSISFTAGLTSFSLEALGHLALARGPVPAAGPISTPHAAAYAMPVLTDTAIRHSIPRSDHTTAIDRESRRLVIAIALSAVAIVGLGTVAALKLTGRFGGDRSVASSSGPKTGRQSDSDGRTNQPSDRGGNQSGPTAIGNSTAQSNPNPRQTPAPSASQPAPPLNEKPIVLRFVLDPPPSAEPPVDPAQAAQFREKLTSVRQNLGKRKLDAARSSADQAARLASTQRQKATAER